MGRELVKLGATIYFFRNITLSEVVHMDVSTLLTNPAVAGAASGMALNIAQYLAKWFKEASKDGKIDKFEVARLLSTVLKVMMLTILLCGTGMDSVTAASSAGAIKLVVTEAGNKLKPKPTTN